MRPKALMLLVIGVCVIPKRWQTSSQQFPLDKWTTYTITRKPCRSSEGKQGVCMFRWDCINLNGLMLSACIDGFLFGACCYIEDKNISSYLISQAIVGETPTTNHQTDFHEYASKDTTNDLSYHTKVPRFTSLHQLYTAIEASTISSSYQESLASYSYFINSQILFKEYLELQNSSEDQFIFEAFSTFTHTSVQEPETLWYNMTVSKTPLLTPNVDRVELYERIQSTTKSSEEMTPVSNAASSITSPSTSASSIKVAMNVPATNSITFQEPNPEELFPSYFKSDETLLLYSPTERLSASTDNDASSMFNHYTFLQSISLLSPSEYFSHFTKEVVSEYTSNAIQTPNIPEFVQPDSDMTELFSYEIIAITTDYSPVSSHDFVTSKSFWTTEFYSAIATQLYDNSESSTMTLPLTNEYLSQITSSQDDFESSSIIDGYNLLSSRGVVISEAATDIQNTAFIDTSSTAYLENLPDSVLTSVAIEMPEITSDKANSVIIPMDINTTSTKFNYGEECGVKYLRSLGRIVGGKNTYFGKWPWQVLVKESAWLGIHVKNKCGGVLINSLYVLTAAHCQPGFLASLMVILGEHDLSNDNEELKPVRKDVKRMIVHREYNSHTLENDLALLELESPVEFQPHILPICLPERGEDFTDQMAFVTGWGKLSHGGTLPTVLQEVRVPIISNSRCQQMFLAAGHIKAIRDTFVCAGYDSGGQDSCEGDSGGPLMVQRNNERWVLVGTVSHGIRCADPNLPGVYMRTAAYRAWIDNIIKVKKMTTKQ